MPDITEQLLELVRKLPEETNYGFYKPKEAKTIMVTLSKHCDDDDVNDVFQDLIDDLDINEQDSTQSLLIISFKDPNLKEPTQCPA